MYPLVPLYPGIMWCPVSAGSPVMSPKNNLSKSWGLTLGSHPPIVGPHAATGIPFKSPLDSIRHLGIPLTCSALGSSQVVPPWPPPCS